MILKGPEETPASCAAMVQAFVDAGLPAGVLNLVYGAPAEISDYLIRHPVIRKVSFTGSVPVGKHLAMLAGQHMKRVTMELGGHAPVVVCADADLDVAVKVLAANKYRNAGQVCVSPTRFLVHEGSTSAFVDALRRAAAQAIKVGDGLVRTSSWARSRPRAGSTPWRGFVADARRHGAQRARRRQPHRQQGLVLRPHGADRSCPRRAGDERGAVRPAGADDPFGALEEAVAEANRLPYGLAAYAYHALAENARTRSPPRSRPEWCRSITTASRRSRSRSAASRIRATAREGGTEAIEAYLVPKLVTQIGL